MQFRAVHLEKTSALGSELVRCCPPPTVCQCRDCDRASVQKRARPPHIFGPFISADRVPEARVADRLVALYTESLSLVDWAMNRKRARAARVSNVPTVVLCASRSPASRSLSGAKRAGLARFSTFPVNSKTRQRLLLCTSLHLVALICVTQFRTGSTGHTPLHACTATRCSPSKSVPAWRTGPRDVVQQMRALRLGSVQVGLDVATCLFLMFLGSRVPMQTLSRADDAMGWLPLAATGSSEAIGAVSRSRSPCRRPGWGSQVGGPRSSHARRFRRRWCNWGHNAPVPGPCGGAT